MPIPGVLSKALIVAAMLTPAMAHENAAAHRYLPAGAENAADRRLEGRAGMSAPNAGAAACDVGDTARLC